MYSLYLMKGREIKARIYGVQNILVGVEFVMKVGGRLADAF